MDENHQAKSLAERRANELAKREGRPLPFPNPWDALDPTKLDPEEATPAAIRARYRAFKKICPPPPCKRYVL